MFRLSAFIVIALILIACQSEPDPPAPGSGPAEDDRVLPPAGWSPKAREISVGQLPILFLQFEGESLTHEDSFIIPARRTPVRFPAFDPAPMGLRDRGRAIEWVTRRVEGYFEATGLQVVADRPARGVYTTIVVGGHPRLVRRGPGVAGIAPFDVGNRSPADIGFVFPEVVALGRGEPDLAQLAAVIAHEAGHTYGLDHVIEMSDLMFPQVHDGMIGFGDAERVDGGWQDAPTILQRVLGVASRETPDCGQDAYAGNDRRADAFEWDGDRLTAATCAGDEDWYVLDLAEGERVILRLEHGSDLSMAPPDVFRPRGRTPLGTSFSAEGLTGTRFVAPVDGRFRIRVTTDEPDGVVYDLVAEIQ